MLSVKNNESTNECSITGILKEMEIKTGTTKIGKDYVVRTAKVAVDQEIYGQMTENIIEVESYANKLKADGTENKTYNDILNSAENYTSLAALGASNAAADTEREASLVSFPSNYCTLTEAPYINKSGLTVSDFRIRCNYMNHASSDDEIKGGFSLTGVIGNIAEEYDNSGIATGRLKIKFILAGYNGRADVVELIAGSDNAKSFVETSLNKGDTVKFVGAISMTHKVVKTTQELAFGSVENTHTEHRKELLITGASYAFEEELSYDEDSVKIALGERQVRLEELKTKYNNRKTAKTASKTSTTNAFGF